VRGIPAGVFPVAFLAAIALAGCDAGSGGLSVTARQCARLQLRGARPQGRLGPSPPREAGQLTHGRDRCGNAATRQLSPLCGEPRALDRELAHMAPAARSTVLPLRRGRRLRTRFRASLRGPGPLPEKTPPQGRLRHCHQRLPRAREAPQEPQTGVGEDWQGQAGPGLGLEDRWRLLCAGEPDLEAISPLAPTTYCSGSVGPIREEETQNLPR
jgi:hypothetical protein